jgi:hypothetical protein
VTNAGGGAEKIVRRGPYPELTLAGVLVQRGIVTERQIQRIKQSVEDARPTQQIPGYKLIAKLGITDYQSTELMDKVFPEIKELRPVPSNKTLRSHMTATWFHTLAALQDKASFPVALFSVGPRYRNEQREDARHLRVHHSASIVVMDPEMSMDAGRAITRDIMQQYGFSDIKFETKTATSKYYAPGQDFVENGTTLVLARSTLINRSINLLMPLDDDVISDLAAVRPVRIDSPIVVVDAIVTNDIPRGLIRIVQENPGTDIAKEAENAIQYVREKRNPAKSKYMLI